MSTKKISSLSKLKKEFPYIFKELKEAFVNAGKNFKVFELDYFVYEESSNVYFLSMSSGHAESLASFDMRGEAFEDEVSVELAEFSDGASSTEDLYDTEDLTRDYGENDVDNV